MAQAWRGAPLTVSIGLAVLGEDGSDSEELIDSAEQARLAAAARALACIAAGRGRAAAGRRARGQLSALATRPA